jgi:hypothetical protein
MKIEGVYKDKTVYRVYKKIASICTNKSNTAHTVGQ